MAEFQKLFKQNLSDKTSQMTSQFKDMADSSGWDEELSKAISVGPLKMNIPTNLTDRVADTEYGNLNNPAKAAMRKFKPGFQKHITEAANMAALECLVKDAPGMFKK